MGKSVVVLLPYIGGQDKVQGCDRTSPGQLVADLQPLCVLCGHGIHDADKRLIACEETVTARQQISFQPALTHMLTQHAIHDTAISCQLVIGRKQLAVPVAVLLLKYLIQTVRHALIRSEDTEVFAVLIEFEYITDITAKLDHILSLGLARLHRNAVLTEIRETKIF